jgi:hypothetical protein
VSITHCHRLCYTAKGNRRWRQYSEEEWPNPKKST